MNKKQIMDVALIPTVVLFALQLISFVTLLIPRFNLYSSSNFSVLPLLGVILYLLPAIIYIYTGYSAVKNYKLELGEAFSIGAMMSALMTLTTTLITAEMTMYQGRTESSFYIYTALISMLFGLVGGSLFNGFLAFVGGAIAQPKSKPETAQAEKKPVDWLVIGALAIVVILVIGFVLFYLGSTPSPRYMSQCTFPAGFTCITQKLQAGTSKLYLRIGQGTGHNIQINGINCTQQTDVSVMTNGSYIYYKNYDLVGAGCANCTAINMSSGQSAVIADSIGVGTATSGAPANASNIICSTSSGAIPGDVGIGSTYNGKIYINYTELDTGLQRIVVGTYTARYES